MAATDDRKANEPVRIDKAQYLLAAALAAVGIYTLVDARGLAVGFGDPVGPRVFPYVIGTSMILLAVLLALATARGDVAEGEAGEDIDLTSPPDWVTVGKLVAILVLNVLFVNLLGWAVTGALLFAGCAWALGVADLAARRARRRRALREQLVLLLRRSRRAAATRDPGRDPLMDTLNLLLDGMASALTPKNLAFAAIGVLLGTFVGVLPGIGPAMAVALLLPITFGLEPTQSFILFAGIYYGGMYGGSTTSILLNTPGESASVMTAIEGNKMAKKGRAAQALATAAIGSFIAGTIGTLLVAFLTPSLADIAVEIGAASYFAIMLLSLVLVTAVLGSSKLRGFIGLFIGLTIGLVGLDLSTGQARLTGGILQLADGVDIVVVAVGHLRHRRGALDRSPPAPPAGRRHPGRPAVHEPRRLGPLLEAVAARYRARLPLRCSCPRVAPRRRPSSPTCSSGGYPARRKSSATVRSRELRDRRPLTTRAPLACSSLFSHSAFR